MERIRSILWTFGLGLGLCFSSAAQAQSQARASSHPRRAHVIIKRQGVLTRRARPNHAHSHPHSSARPAYPRANARMNVAPNSRPSLPRANPLSRPRPAHPSVQRRIGVRHMKVVQGRRGRAGLSMNRPSSARPNARPNVGGRARINRPAVGIPGHSRPRVNRAHVVSRPSGFSRVQHTGTRRTKLVGVSRRRTRG